MKFIAHYGPRGGHRDRTLWVKRSAPGGPVARPWHPAVTRVTPPENRPAPGTGTRRSAAVAQPPPAVPSPRAPSPSQTAPAGNPDGEPGQHVGTSRAADGAPPCPAAPWAPLSPTRRPQWRNTGGASTWVRRREGAGGEQRRTGPGGGGAGPGRGRGGGRADSQIQELTDRLRVEHRGGPLRASSAVPGTPEPSQRPSFNSCSPHERKTS